MLAVKGLFDGKNIRLLEKVRIEKPQEVVITFLETNENKRSREEIYKLAEIGGSFDFLNEPAEDIYFDSDLKVRYKI